MALTPPENRLWWNEPLHKMEIVWITIAFLWGVIMFLTMIYWHIAGKQNLSNEAYKIKPEVFAAKAEAFVNKYKVREEGATKIPVVRPPAGGDAYLVARTWDWWPILELEKGQSYRLRMSSMDWQHGFSLQPTNINIQVHPDYEMVLTVTPTQSGEFAIICNEFCGVGHHTMLGRIYVVDKK